MITRRRFVQSSAAALPLLALRNPRAWAAGHIPLGLQLYTVRSETGQKLPAVLKQIRAIGYQEVEAFSGLYSAHSAAELRKMVEDAGLTMPSAHFEYPKFAERFDYAKKLGVKWMVCPMLPHALWGADGFATAAKQFNEWGKRAQEMGMRLAFHNHDYEFKSVAEGKTGYDVLVAETDPKLVFFELDCYWAAQAGNDPLTMLKRLGRRVRLLHLKDRKPGFPSSNDMGPSSAHFTEVGHGTIAWKPILATAERLDVEYYFVEQDRIDGDPMASIRSSYEYLRSVMG